MNSIFKKLFIIGISSIICLLVSCDTHSLTKKDAQNLESEMLDLPDKVSQTKAYIEGKHYQRLKYDIPTANKEKIEVIEFFWYACSHCYRFEPIINVWSKQLEADVYLKKIPAVWNKTMEAHARIFYAIKAMNVVDQVHMPLMVAMNENRKRLDNLDSISEFMKQHKIDIYKFRKTYTSFGISSLVRQGKSKTVAAGMRGTPELLVNGKYRVTASMAGSLAGMLRVANYLIAKERK